MTTSSSTTTLAAVNATFNINGVVNLPYGTVSLIDSAAYTATLNVAGRLNIGRNLSPYYTGGGVGVINVPAGGAINILGTGVADFTNASATVTGAGAFTMSAGATINVGAAAGLDSANGPVKTTTRTFATTANYAYVGTAAQSTGSGLPSAVAGLTVNNAAGLSLTNNVEVDTALTMTLGSLSLNSKTLTYGSAAKLVYSGTAAQTTSAELLSTVPNLTVNNANGIALASGTTVSGALTFTAGKISTGTNTLVAKAANITGSGTGKFVDGNLKCPVTATGVYAFPVGKGSDYLPDTLNFTALTGTGNVLVAVTDSSVTPPVPALDPSTKILKRYFHMAKDAGITAFVANISLSYADADLVAAGVVDESTLNVVGSNGTLWTQIPAAVRDPADNTLQIAGVSSLLDYAIAYSGGVTRKIVTIAQARKDDDHDFVPDYKVSGDTLVVYGVVISPNLGATYSSYYIQDATAGIDVYKSTKMSFSIGDSVFVIGTVTQNKGLTEISPLAADSAHFGLLKHNAVIPKAKHLTLHDYVLNAETYEGSLVEVDSLYKASGTWGSGQNVYVTNAAHTDTTILYINANTSVASSTEPTYPINLVGSGSQYTSSVPANNGYEIIPRDTTDISKTKLLSVVTIADAKVDLNHDFIPDHSVTGDILMVTGVVTSPNLGALSNYSSYFIQDNTGGIDVYCPTLESFQIGDSLVVIGTLDVFNGLTELVPLVADSAHFGYLKHNAVLPKPKLLSLHSFVRTASYAESYEGQLVQLDTLYKASGTWPGAGSSASVYMTGSSKADTMQLFVNKNTDVPGWKEPAYPINLVGVVSQYGTDSTGYEIIPRDTTDISKTKLISVVTIADAKVDLNHDFIPDHSVTGDTLMVSGVVTSPNLGALSNYSSYFMQDNTGGVDVYCPTLESFQIGDSLVVIGTLDVFNGLTEIVPLVADSAHFGYVKHHAVLPKPKLLSLHSFVRTASYAESYEGQLVQLDTLYKASGTWPGAGTSASVYLTSASKADTMQLFVNKNTDVAGWKEPAYPINVVGVVSQYGTDSTGYEIIPRDTTDIVPFTIVGVKDQLSGIPADFYLHQNYPNPFNPSTTIQYGLPRDVEVQIDIYNVLGQRVAMLVDGLVKAGNHEVVFNADRFASGVYFYVMRAGDQVFKQKMLLMK